ncbi:hypothetical protein AB0H42_35905 [Nocardia sp. NPDC050799]
MQQSRLHTRRRAVLDNLGERDPERLVRIEVARRRLEQGTVDI